jgi:hypothetical protein
LAEFIKRVMVLAASGKREWSSEELTSHPPIGLCRRITNRFEGVGIEAFDGQFLSAD